MIYFDHNATTPMDERVVAAMMPFLHRFHGNPSSLYRLGRLARTAVDTAREQLAALIEVTPEQVIFTSGGTEANNMALGSLTAPRSVVISTIEHPSIMEPASRLKQRGVRVHTLAVDSTGVVCQTALTNVLANKPQLLSVMLANNETGAIQPIADIARQAKAINCLVHTDAVQALGKTPLSFNQLGIDMMSLSSHKIYGPKGVGALVINQKYTPQPLLLGGGQERGLRAGTENVAGIIGFGKAAELAKLEFDQRQAQRLKLKLKLEQALHTLPGLTIFAESANRLPNTIQFGINGLDGEMLLMRLDKKSIAVSSGSACASGEHLPSPVLQAMGITAEQAKTAVRVSLGHTNSEADIDEFINQLKTLLHD